MPRSESPRSPYPGLRPFEAHEADLFFGREPHVDALLDRLSRSHFVAVIGESGAGKSSLVRAGLLPALEAGFVVEAGSNWRVAVMRPGGAPLGALADVLLGPGVLSESGGVPRREFALAELRRGPFGLVQLVRDAHLDRHCNTLVVIDQFEELFRYCREPAQKDQANVFVELLLRASEQREVPIFVVLTMRSDFVGECARFRGLPERLNDNHYFTPRLTRDQIAAAIREPARVCGGVVESTLVDELCNAVGDDQDQLPLLQHLLMRLWERANQESDRPRLTSGLSRQMGGLHSALNNHAQQVYDSLASHELRAIARTMFKSLTDPHSQRRDLRRDALVSEVAAVAAAPIDATIAVADAFRAEGRHMLMPPAEVPLDATSRLDISHESLLRQWSSLSQWALEEGAHAREFDRLRHEAQREREQEAELLSGRDLARAQDWVRQARPTPGWAERYAPAGELDATLTFITRSEAEANRRQEIRAAAREADARRQRYYTGGALVAATLVMIVAIVIFDLWREAESQTALAQTNAERARVSEATARDNERKAITFGTAAESLARDLAAQKEQLARERAELHTNYLATSARAELAGNAALAVLLAREAVQETHADDRAIRTLRDAIAAHVPSIEAPFDAPTSRSYVDPGKTGWVDFSLDGSSLSSRDNWAITPSKHDAIIWSVNSGQPVMTLRGHTGTVGSAIFSPDGRLAVTTSADHTAIVWNASTGKPLKSLPHEQMINGAIFNRSGALVVTLGDDRRAIVWNVADYSTRCELEYREGFANFIVGSFSHDQNLLATVTHHGSARWRAQVWNVASDTCPRVAVPVLDESEDVMWASFSSQKSWLGVVVEDGEVIVLNASNGWKEQARFAPDVRYQPGNARTPAEGLPPPVAWSKDGNYFAAAGGDNVVYVVAIENSNRRVELRGHTGRITSISFGPDDDRLLTTSTDGTARLWTLGSDKRVLERLILTGHQKAVGSAAFSSSGGKVVTAGDDARVRAWTPVLSVAQKELPGLRTASYSADGKRIWAAGVDIQGPVGRRVNRESGSWVSELIPATLAPRNEQRTFQTIPRGFQALRLIEEPGMLETDRFDGASPDRQLVFGTVNNGRTAIWDLRAPHVRPESVLDAPRWKGSPCVATGISNDKRLAWYCAEADAVLITSAELHQPIAITIVDKAKVEYVRFSTTGRWVALALEDSSVEVFEAHTGRRHSLMRGHDGMITNIDFTADDRFLVSASEDSTARVWDVAGGPEIAVLAPTNVSRLTGATFSPDGLSVLLLSADRLLQWRCYACGDRTALLDEVRRRNIRALSGQERRHFRLDLPEGVGRVH